MSFSFYRLQRRTTEKAAASKSRKEILAENYVSCYSFPIVVA
jgi:hypothetical protein